MSPFYHRKAHLCLPVFRWADQSTVAQRSNGRGGGCAAQGKTGVSGGLRLGKAQALLSMARPRNRPYPTHTQPKTPTACCAHQGITLPDTILADADEPRRTTPAAICCQPPWCHCAVHGPRKFAPQEPAFRSEDGRAGCLRRRRARRIRGLSSRPCRLDGLFRRSRRPRQKIYIVTNRLFFTDVFSRYLADSGWHARCAYPVRGAKSLIRTAKRMKRFSARSTLDQSTKYDGQRGRSCRFTLAAGAG